MNDLDLFRRARPDIAPLDDATAEELRRAVFGTGTSTRTSVSRLNGRRVMAVAVALAAAAALAVSVTRGDGTRSISPATPTDSLSTATSVTTGQTVAAPSTDPPPTDDWRLRPASRFQPPEEWNVLFEQAREANIGRCMAAAGFDYHGNPYDTDSEVADAAAGIQPGTYEAAFFGTGGAGGGCLDGAYRSIFGTVRAEVAAEEVRSWASAEWRRSALGDPEVLRALETLATCAREHGVEVRDVGTAPSKALDDISRGMSEQTAGDPRLVEVQVTTPDQSYVHTIEEMRAVAEVVQNEWCPPFQDVFDLLAARTDDAAVIWIESNPDTMADIDAEFAEDIERFRYIIEHDGELPPS